MKGKFDKIIESDTPVLVLWYDTVEFDLDFDDNKDAVISLLDAVKTSLGDKLRVIKIAVTNDTNKHLTE